MTTPDICDPVAAQLLTRPDEVSATPFVRPPNPVPLLLPPAHGRTFPEGPLSAAFSSLQQLYVPLCPHHLALTQMRRLFQAASVSGRHKGLALIGNSGAGKSTTLRKLDEWLRVAYGTAPGALSPLLIVLTPSDSSHKALLSAILGALGDPFSSTGTAPALAQRVKRFVAERQVVALALDEFQHVFEGRTSVQARAVSQALKNLFNALEIPIIVVGLESIRAFIEGSRELAQRVTRKVVLKDMSLQNKDDLRDLRALLREMDGLLSLTGGCRLDSEAMLIRLFVASHGNLGSLVDLVRRACEIAMVNGAAKIDLSDFSEAFRESAKAEEVGVDPFVLPLEILKPKAMRLGDRT